MVARPNPNQMEKIMTNQTQTKLSLRGQLLAQDLKSLKKARTQELVNALLEAQRLLYRHAERACRDGTREQVFEIMDDATAINTILRKFSPPKG